VVNMVCFFFNPAFLKHQLPTYTPFRHRASSPDVHRDLRCATTSSIEYPASSIQYPASLPTLRFGRQEAPTFIGIFASLRHRDLFSSFIYDWQYAMPHSFYLLRFPRGRKGNVVLLPEGSCPQGRSQQLQYNRDKAIYYRYL
jgi:hypothetical protein